MCVCVKERSRTESVVHDVQVHYIYIYIARGLGELSKRAISARNKRNMKYERGKRMKIHEMKVGCE